VWVGGGWFLGWVGMPNLRITDSLPFAML
jgi:hypothetical protein